jgi:hypothetical protein
MAQVEVDIETRIRDLCQEILKEEDPTRVRELIGLLRSVVEGGQDETRMRVRLIAKRYRQQISSLALGRDSETRSNTGSRIPALLRFLGLRADFRLEREPKY